MNILVVGSGGREHAIVWKVAQSPHSARVFCAPGNAGTSLHGENVAIDPSDIGGLVKFAKEYSIDLTIVGPEGPLCAGIVDRFEAAGLRIFGPRAEAARLEGDKCFSKKLMLESRIPTATGKTFGSFVDARGYIESRETGVVVKAAGLAGGKGVLVCDDPAGGLAGAERMMLKGEFGEAGRTIVVEEKLVGEELSVHALIDGRNILILPSSQDHKRVGDGGTGPNTGGMGAYSPSPAATAEVMATIEAEILVPTLDALVRHEIEFRGVLYCGLMLTAGGPKVLEYNCRLGDPEAQVILPRLESDIIELMEACIDGRLDEVAVTWSSGSSLCVVAAAEGYPGEHTKGAEISGLSDARGMEGVQVFHAGTRQAGDRIVTNGGRVLGVTGTGETLSLARDRAYDGMDKIAFDGAFHRSDIGHRALPDRVPTG
jgi:phosphoribosylamine---glycine ligase